MFTVGEIAKVCRGALIGTDSSSNVSGVSTDSRTIRAGELFVALRGPNFDGHSFINEAFRRGAACALVDQPGSFGFPSLVVENVLKAMQSLARYYRSRFAIPVVAVTGSAGKTTTKEYISAVLSEILRVRSGLGNWNNHIGVPLNIFRLAAHDECFVLELGANHKGEIAFLAKIAQPTIGVITGIYPVHLEGFGSLADIYEAKLELADYLERHSGIMIANGDDPELLRRLKQKKVRLVTFGRGPDCDYVLSALEVGKGWLRFKVNRRHEFKLQGYGAFNVQNALAAIATGGVFNLDLDELSRSWKVAPEIQSRFRVSSYASRDIQVVDDSYNANPQSFERAIESFSQFAGERRKIVVAGDMLELGDQAEHFHRAIGRKLAEEKICFVIGVGPMSRFILEEFGGRSAGDQVHHVEDAGEASRLLASILRDGDSVLIKGSHSIKLDQVKPKLDEYFRTKAATVS